MRKTGAGPSKRMKERRRDEEPPQTQQPLQPRPSSVNQSGSDRERNEQTPSTTNAVVVPEQKKMTADDTSLQSKNFRLAKELSEIRVRHREECKHVTRLTMENMNLASRCREAMSQVAIIKKELSQQKKKATEAIVMQKKLTEQLGALQNGGKSSTIISSHAVEVSPEVLSSSDSKPRKHKSSNAVDNHNPRQRIVSEDNPKDITSEQTTKIKKVVNVNTVTASSSARVTDVAAELDRMDQILAEHQQKVGNLLNNRHTALDPLEIPRGSSKNVSQLIVQAVINHQQPSNDEKLERIISIASHDGVDFDTIEHKEDDKDYLIVEDNETEKSITEYFRTPDVASSNSDAFSSSAPVLNLVSSDDYEDDILETTDLPESEDPSLLDPSAEDTTTEDYSESFAETLDDNDPEVQTIEDEPTNDENAIQQTGDSVALVQNAKTPVDLNVSADDPSVIDISPDDSSAEEPSSEGPMAEESPVQNSPKEGISPSARQSWLETESNNGTLPIHLNTQKFFPYTASPKIDLSRRGMIHSRNYNEEFPEDITPSRRKPSLEHKSPSSIPESLSKRSEPSQGIPKFKCSSKKLNKEAVSLNSIDAFEASFNMNFADSFSPREASIAEENEGEADASQSKQDIYDPFSISPVREVEIGKHLDNSQHHEFLRDSQLPSFDSPSFKQIPSDSDRKPVLGFKASNGLYRDFEAKKFANSRESNVAGNGLRDRATIAYHRSAARRTKNYDPPGKDKTSQRPSSDNRNGNMKDSYRQIEEKFNSKETFEGDYARNLNGSVGLKDHEFHENLQDSMKSFDGSGHRRQALHSESMRSDSISPTSSTSSSKNKPSFDPMNGKSSLGNVSRVSPALVMGPLPSSNTSKTDRVNPLDKQKPTSKIHTSTAPFMKTTSPTFEQRTKISTSNESLHSEKTSFVSVRAKYEELRGRTHAPSNLPSVRHSDEVASNPTKATPDVTINPSPIPFRERVAKYVESATSPSISGTVVSNEKDSKNGYLSSYQVKPTKFGVAVNSISSLFASSNTRPLDVDDVGDGDIPMISNLSPPKINLIETNNVTKPSHNNMEEQKHTSNLKSSRNNFDDGDNMPPRRGNVHNRSSYTVPSTTEYIKGDGGEDDDIIEITKPSSSYDRFALDLNKRLPHVKPSMNNSNGHHLSSSTSRYRYQDTTAGS